MAKIWPTRSCRKAEKATKLMFTAKSMSSTDIRMMMTLSLIHIFDHLEIGAGRIEALPDDERHGEVDERGPQGDPARIARDVGFLAAQQQDREGARQRQEDGE